MSDHPLTTALLISAYSRGYFPMPDPDNGDMLWFHPDPRAILPLDNFHVSRSLRRTMRRSGFRLSINEAFADVMRGCAEREETWITPEMEEAYTKLHAEGFAHSVEVWQNDQLAGGVYGVSLAGGFFAESMFHRVTDASKIALHHLTMHMRARGMSLLEVQFMTDHLRSLGAIEIPRDHYMALLTSALRKPVTFT